jgi:hypothetical protein
MMLFLARNVFLHLIQIGLAHGEVRVASLPFKIPVGGSLLLKPTVGNAFYLLHPFRLCDSATVNGGQGLRHSSRWLTQPRWGCGLVGSLTQGSSFLATLGWRAKSRGDFPAAIEQSRSSDCLNFSQHKAWKFRAPEFPMTSLPP